MSKCRFYDQQSTQRSYGPGYDRVFVARQQPLRNAYPFESSAGVTGQRIYVSHSTSLNYSSLVITTQNPESKTFAPLLSIFCLHSLTYIHVSLPSKTPTHTISHLANMPTNNMTNNSKHNYEVLATAHAEPQHMSSTGRRPSLYFFATCKHNIAEWRARHWDVSKAHVQKNDLDLLDVAVFHSYLASGRGLR